MDSLERSLEWWENYKRATPVGKAFMNANGRWRSEHPGENPTGALLDDFWKEAAEHPVGGNPSRSPRRVSHCALASVIGMDVVTYE